MKSATDRKQDVVVDGPAVQSSPGSSNPPSPVHCTSTYDPDCDGSAVPVSGASLCELPRETESVVLLSLQESNEKQKASLTRCLSAEKKRREQSALLAAATGRRSAPKAMLTVVREIARDKVVIENVEGRALDQDDATRQAELKVVKADVADLWLWLANADTVSRLLEVHGSPPDYEWRLYLAQAPYARANYQRFVRSCSGVTITEKLVPGIPDVHSEFSGLPKRFLTSWFRSNWLLIMPEKGYGVLICHRHDMQALDEELTRKTSHGAHLEVTTEHWGLPGTYYVGSFLPRLCWMALVPAVTGNLDELFDPAGYSQGTESCSLELLKTHWRNENNGLLFCVLKYTGFNTDYFHSIEEYTRECVVSK